MRLASIFVFAAWASLAQTPMVRIPAGELLTIDDAGDPRKVQVAGFLLDRFEVTYTEFDRFVQATGYRTRAELDGVSGVFDLKAGEWRPVPGADWRHPHGPGSQALANEPVVQLSFDDAEAYAKWTGKRLPTDSEWEFAARGGAVGKLYPWGNELRPGEAHQANLWQGVFPARNTAGPGEGGDGYPRLAPVGSFSPNGYGLYDMAGNAWEWVATVPHGQPAESVLRIVRGGSWLCNESSCRGYRLTHRGQGNRREGLNNLGFRCARDLAPGDRIQTY